MMNLKNILLLLFSSIIFNINAQDAQRIELTNPSFEDFNRHSQPPRGWINCGMDDESPPDVQPGAFQVSKTAQDGFTYLGMVTRDNDTWERVGQRLSTPLIGGQCYQFSIHLTYSEDYFSLSRTTGKNEFFVKPVLLRIWGGNKYCDTRDLLGESELVKNPNWKEYQFKLKPKGDYKYIVLEAFYKTPTMFTYNGNLLVDNASDIVPVGNCDEEEWDEEIMVKTEEPENVEPETPPVTNVAPPKKEDEKIPEPEEVIKPSINPDPPTKSNKIIEELSIDKVKEGQSIRIEKLDFLADDYTILENMHPVLDEIYSFLKENDNVIIEIGGHTNRRPSVQYCDWLSQNRAWSVRKYLLLKGIDKERISYKGYGKSQPIDTTNTPQGEKRNQRVEIKILSLGG